MRSRAALPLEAELGVLETVPDLVVGDRERPLLTDVLGIGGQRRPLPVAILAQLGWGGGVVAVAVDDHRGTDRIVGPRSGRS